MQNGHVDEAQRGLVVKGVIRTQTGVPLEGASVNVSDAQGFDATYSDETGTYSLAVPPGKYTFDFFAPFPSQVVSVEGRVVTVDKSMTMDVTLPTPTPTAHNPKHIIGEDDSWIALDHRAAPRGARSLRHPVWHLRPDGRDDRRSDGGEMVEKITGRGGMTRAATRTSDRSR